MASAGYTREATPPTVRDSAAMPNSQGANQVPGGGRGRSPAVNAIVHSEIGVTALLTCFKLSISSCRDLAVFLKKRAILEDEQAQGLQKLCKSTQESLRRPDSRQGSYSRHLDEMTHLHDRLAENGIGFAQALHQMHDDLSELANNMERGRKYWKNFGMNADKRANEAEIMIEKAKAKYDSCAEEYDRVRTGDRKAVKSFGFKGSRSGAQHEEELQRRFAAAAADYESKVHAANAQRHELVTVGRPQAVQAIQDMIHECNSGLTVRLQQYGQLMEKLALLNGLTISPPKEANRVERSLRDIISSIGNEGDFTSFMTDFASKTPANASQLEFKFEPHPSFMPQQPQQRQQLQPQQMQYQKMQQQQQQQPPSQQQLQHQQQLQLQHQQQQQQQQSPSQQQQPPSQQQQPPSQQQLQHQQQFQLQHQQQQQQPPFQQQQPPSQQQLQQQQQLQLQHQQQHLQLQHQQPPPLQQSLNQQQIHHLQQQRLQQQQQLQRQQQLQWQQQQHQVTHPSQQPITNQPTANDAPPHTPYASSTPRGSTPPQQQFSVQSQGFGAVVQQPAILPISVQPPIQRRSSQNSNFDLPRLRPVFGVPLEDLLIRDDCSIPIIVSQCIQAVDLFGLNAEGIYRKPGEKKHVDRIKSMFDNDATCLDFRRPEDFFNDVNSVASVLKQFLRDLPEPLLTNELYEEFIDAAKVDDNISRRDSLHGLINKLPNPNYATLHMLIVHLHRVAEHSNMNRMTSKSLATCFGPTLMGSMTNSSVADTNWQVRAIETVLEHCYSIFYEE